MAKTLIALIEALGILIAMIVVGFGILICIAFIKTWIEDLKETHKKKK